MQGSKIHFHERALAARFVWSTAPDGRCFQYLFEQCAFAFLPERMLDHCNCQHELDEGQRLEFTNCLSPRNNRMRFVRGRSVIIATRKAALLMWSTEYRKIKARTSDGSDQKRLN